MTFLQHNPVQSIPHFNQSQFTTETQCSVANRNPHTASCLNTDKVFEIVIIHDHGDQLEIRVISNLTLDTIRSITLDLRDFFKEGSRKFVGDLVPCYQLIFGHVPVAVVSGSLTHPGGELGQVM